MVFGMSAKVNIPTCGEHCDELQNLHCKYWERENIVVVRRERFYHNRREKR